VVTVAMAISKITRRRRSAACKKAVGGRSRAKARSVTAAGGARSRSRRRASVVPAVLRRRGRSRSRDSGTAARYAADVKKRSNKIKNVKKT